VEILDGGVGSELERPGITLALPRWTAHVVERAPERLSAIHAAYAAAGATVHTAATFRTQPHLYGERFAALTARAVLAARSAVPSAHRVAGSVAPVMDCWHPELAPAAHEARVVHASMARALTDAGVDVLLCETFASETEALVAVEACVATGTPTWLSLTAGPDGSLLSVEALRRTARDAASLGAAAVLVNCVTAERTDPYVEALAGLGVPFGAYANWSREGGPDAYVALAARWAAHGATLIGGCCGTTPDDIRGVASALR